MLLKYIISFIAGVLLGLMLMCSRSKADSIADKINTKVEVRYRYVTTIDTFKDDKPKVKYHKLTKDSLLYIPNSTSTTTIKDFQPSSYAYTYQKSFYSEGNRVRNDINIKGWGKLEDIQSSFTIHDTLADTIKTVTTTKFRASSALFAGFRYQQSPDGSTTLKQAEIDWNIRNKVLLGVGLGLDQNNQAVFGGKVGVRIK